MLLISCNKDETYLMDYFDGQPTASTQVKASNDVEAASVSTCECQYRIYSIDGTPGSGNHLEVLANTWQNSCPGCAWALGYYGCYFNSFWGGNACANNMDAGLFTFPTKWIPFNCSIPDNTAFKKRLNLVKVTSGCSLVGDVSDGEVVYGIRCKKESCSSDWEYSASTLFDIPSSVAEFDIEMGGDCGCLPTIVN